MAKVTPISQRKSDHIRINLEENVRSGFTTGLERYRFDHEALPDFNLEDVDLNIEIFNKKLSSPIMISSMTGGTEKAAQINRNLAIAAQETDIAMGLGSQRAAFDHPDLVYTYQVRKYAPDILLFANLGAIQLNYQFGLDHCLKAIDMVEADGLILHLNPLQEALQEKGDTRFAGLLSKIESICNALSVPVIVKEVGWGISADTAKRLVNAGVKAIDVAGAGGTSWSQVEMYNAENPDQSRLASAFKNWGIPTAESLVEIHRILPRFLLFASGGIRSGIDIAKCIALGAALCGMASPFLKAASISEEKTIGEIHLTTSELSIAMFAAGAKNITSLSKTPLKIL